MKYRDLKIWQLANEVSLKIHELSLKELPSFELYETGAQIRRSSKSVKSNIVEGFGRKQSKKEFLHFLRFSLASNEETLDHLDTLFHTGSLKNGQLYQKLRLKIDLLGKMINQFIKAVEKNHRV